MSDDRSLIKKWLQSSLVLFSQKVGIQVIAAVAQLVVIPYLSPGEFGEYLLLVSIGQLLSPFLHWGISTSITKHASAYIHDKASISAILSTHGRILLTLDVVFLIFIGVLMVGIGTLFGEGVFGLQTSYHLASLLVVLMAIVTAAELVVPQTLLALDKVMLSAFLSGGPRSIFFLLLVLGSTTSINLDLEQIIWFQILASLLGFLVCFGVYFHETRTTRRMDSGGVEGGMTVQNDSRAILTLGFSVMGSYLLAQARNTMEPILIRLFFGIELTGLVGAARRVASIINLAAQSFSAILGPYAARFNTPETQSMLQTVHAAVALLTALLAFTGLGGLIIFGDAPLTMVFGPTYTASYPYLVAMLLLVTIRCLAGFPIHILLVRGRENYVLISYVFDLLASAIVFAGAWYTGDIMNAIIGVGLVQLIQYTWLSWQTKSKLDLRVDAFVLISGHFKCLGSN